MNIENNKKFVETFWDQTILPTLMDYVRIPNKSPLFDREWRENGHMEKAVKLIVDWCEKNKIENMKLEIVRLENRTPVILIDVPGSNDETILLYGHLDKQPEMTGWESDLDPWKPVLKGEKLYGRGAADDGYAVFASLAAIKSLRAQNIPHARCVILIESSEESGSVDLPFYISALEDRIGNPSLIICLDSGCGNYDQLWMTTSLRGLIGGVLKIDVLKEGVHSGCGSGVVPSCFTVLRQLLNRIENEAGQVILKECFVDIPPERLEQARNMAKVLGKNFLTSFPFVDEVQPGTHDISELLLNRTWRPALSVIGCDGLPKPESAGNVTIPSLKIKLSMRIPPTCSAQAATLALKNILEKNPPFQAKVAFDTKEANDGWNAPIESPWLVSATKVASENYFGKEAVCMGEGGSIPFMGMLGKKFPKAQFVITGVLGPHSNAHGPNEFLHIPTGKKLTAVVAEIIAKHCQR